MAVIRMSDHPDKSLSQVLAGFSGMLIVDRATELGGSQAVQVSEAVSLRFEIGGYLNNGRNNQQVLTLNGCGFEAERRRILGVTTPNGIAYTPTLECGQKPPAIDRIYPEWWGAIPDGEAHEVIWRDRNNPRKYIRTDALALAIGFAQAVGWGDKHSGFAVSLGDGFYAITDTVLVVNTITIRGTNPALSRIIMLTTEDAPRKACLILAGERTRKPSGSWKTTQIARESIISDVGFESSDGLGIGLQVGQLQAETPHLGPCSCTFTNLRFRKLCVGIRQERGYANTYINPDIYNCVRGIELLGHSMNTFVSPMIGGRS
ncbi:MAG: hypothetical protein ABIJ61_14810, partial [bacterium]